MRVLVDYRPALRQPSGVGEYARQLVAGLVEREDRRIDVTLFSSSWKDRLTVPDSLHGVTAVDLRIPVSLLNFTWHRFGWPAAEALLHRSFDVTHSLHPLLLPSSRAAQVVTIHDVNFLTHPERTRAEIHRDYPGLARAHAHRADRILVPSRFTAGEVERRLGVSPDRITVCSPGAPDWTPRMRAPNGYILFLGTLEPRKNVGTLLEAYERLLAASPPSDVPELLLAGGATSESAPWLDRISRPPLAGHVRHLGYVPPTERKGLYEGARMLVQPSFEEGFGLPILEAMTLGVPVVAANRGALPEVAGDAGLLVDPEDAAALASAIRTLIDDGGLAAACSERGIARSRQFRRSVMAERAFEAYQLAIEARRRRNGR